MTKTLVLIKLFLSLTILAAALHVTQFLRFEIGMIIVIVVMLAAMMAVTAVNEN